MARPTRKIISSGISAWDGDVDANFGNLTDSPFPIFQVDLVGELPAASLYDDCFALVGDDLYQSNGTAWSPYLGEAANVPDSTATTVSQMASDFNDLLAALQNAGIMATS